MLFVDAYGKILAELGRADVVLRAGADLGTAATGAVKTAVQAQAKGDVDLKVSVGLACAVTELGKVGGVITTATDNLKGSVTAAGSLGAELAP